MEKEHIREGWQSQVTANYVGAVLRIRPEIAGIEPYVAGRPIEEIARAFGFEPDRIAKLASNESPDGPFPGVAEAVHSAIATAHRYPEDEAWDLTTALAAHLNVSTGNIVLGNGSVALINDATIAVGGAGTRVVFPWPSFVMYPLAATYAGSTPVRVPLAADMALDLAAMREAIDDATSLVFLCNPNNPTGTVLGGSEVEEFIRSVPESVLVVVDEAYHEYVDEPSYHSAISLALELPNVMVLRTFSKIYALAGFRIGYGVAGEGVVSLLKKVRPPFSVSRLAQAAALTSLGQQDEVARRASINAAGRHYLKGALDERGYRAIGSQANFIFFHTGLEDSGALADALVQKGIIIRPMPGGWVRVSIGSESENRRFVAALDAGS